ncbi:tRNA pseudouridine(38-40) synthase TruA [Nitrosophilus alvini]|uniref:tRNA pseudouridine(38-40) synthase TruA n=1 Tax=Nitrosophilus alvini TaxID=2714855 RepID=UPI00190A66E9|nr:tRNA pseudouridine(38-40) synthase TruA [Nitrosophilus alvini]
MRAKAIISYDGSRFHGFQSQKHTSKTVIGTLQKALKKTGIETKITGSGRTDRGVHATGQVIHFDLPPFWNDTQKLQSYLNRYLFPSILFKKIEIVSDDFHARYSAKRRAYRYIFSMDTPNPFSAQYITFLENFDYEKCKNAVKLFEGRHNFEYFKKEGSGVTNFERTIYKACIYRYKNYYILYFEADGFLRSQVRMMADFLFKIGRGDLTLKELAEQLSCKHQYSSTLAPPYGLYLCRVFY